MNKFGKVILSFSLLLSSSAFAERVRLLAKDSDALQARVDLIQQAKKEIQVEYFSVWNDDESIGGFALLLDAAQRGIQVKVIMDSLSNTVPKAVFSALLEKGKDSKGNQNLEIRVYNPISLKLSQATHRDHAKMLIVDGASPENGRMIIGGRNVGDKYFGLNPGRNFRDMDVLLDGDVVQTAQANFFRVWDSGVAKEPALYEFDAKKLQVGACMPSLDDYDGCERTRANALKIYDQEIVRIREMMRRIFEGAPSLKVQTQTHFDWLSNLPTDTQVKFLSQDPDGLVSKETATMSEELKVLAGKTQTDINIISPYLIPTPGLIEVFEKLLARQVRVRIITNSMKSTDNLFAQAGYLKAKAKLIQMGVEIYEYQGPDTAHAKVAVIDGHIALVGTYNLDPRSGFVNREVGVAIMKTSGNYLARQLTEQIDFFRENSLLVGKDGQAQNLDKQETGVSSTKKALVKALMLIFPLIKNQI